MGIHLDSVIGSEGYCNGLDVCAGSGIGSWAAGHVNARKRTTRPPLDTRQRMGAAGGNGGLREDIGSIRG